MSWNHGILWICYRSRFKLISGWLFATSVHTLGIMMPTDFDMFCRGAAQPPVDMDLLRCNRCSVYIFPDRRGTRSLEDYQFLSEAKNNFTAAWQKMGRKSRIFDGPSSKLAQKKGKGYHLVISHCHGIDGL